MLLLGRYGPKISPQTAPNRCMMGHLAAWKDREEIPPPIPHDGGRYPTCFRHPFLARGRQTPPLSTAPRRPLIVVFFALFFVLLRGRRPQARYRPWSLGPNCSFVRSQPSPHSIAHPPIRSQGNDMHGWQARQARLAGRDRQTDRQTDRERERGKP